MTVRAKFGLASFLALAAPALAQAAEVRPAVVFGYDTGGDKIVNVTFTNGDTQSIRAGEGLYLGGGVSILNDDKNLEFLGTVNYKYAAIHADNGDITWTRVPIDALLFYRWEKVRLGGGLTFQLSPKLKGSGQASNVNVNVDNAVGLLVQADYLMGKIALGARATFVDFKANGTSASGNSVGVTFGIAF